MKVAVLDDWFDSLRHLSCFQYLDGFEVDIYSDHIEDINSLVKRLLPYEAITLFRERTPIKAELVNELPNLKLISLRSAYSHIDIEACTKNNVLVCSNLNSGNPPYAAAEHTWALILAAMRNLPTQMRSLQKGNWQIGIGKTLQGRTIGLYGYGRIAKQVAKYAKAFGMKVVWWGSENGRSRAAEDGEIIASNRKEFFSKPDIISIHVRLNNETKNLISPDDFSNMRFDSLFVNTSRAGLIEEGALLAGLNKGRPGNAAVDVFDIEPITWTDDPLACHPRVVATPHIGFVTEDELEIQFSDIFSQVAAFQKKQPINMINPQAFD